MLDKSNVDLLKCFLPFWEKISCSEKDKLVTNTESIFFRKGANIYSAAKECVGVLIVKSGELRTYILSEDGKEITLYRLNKGEVCILSASCLLRNITFDVLIDAEQDTEALLINYSFLEQLQSSNPYVENFALRIAVERFSDVMRAVEQILFMSFDQRLAVFLLDEATRTGTVNLTLTHEQIAKYTGSAREVVSRMLKYFVREGVVELHRGSVKIIDKEYLLKLLINK